MARPCCSWHNAAAANENGMAIAKAIMSADCVHPDERTVAALRDHAHLAETMRRFATALQDEVFVQSVICDAKDARTHQKVLLRADSYLVLQIIWKESGFITDEELRAAGLARNFAPGMLTCYKLGVELAPTKQEVAASNTRVATVVAAAEIYDLVIRDTVRTKHRPLVGTPLLHGIMIDIIHPLTPHPVTPLTPSKSLDA